MAKYLDVNTLYRIWAREYDTYPNPLIELEERIVPSMIGNLEGKTVLDIGCGTGRYSINFAEKAARVIAVDFCKPMLKTAQKKSANPNLTFICSDLARIPLKRQCDVVLCNLVLSHIENLDKALSEISRLANKASIVIISDLRTNFGIKKAKKLRIFKHFATNLYKHTLKDYSTAFHNNGFVLTDFHKLVFDKQMAKRHKRLFYLTGFTIGYVFKLEKKSE